MKIVEQSITLMEDSNGEALLWKIEAAARNCYKSEYANADHDPVVRDRLIRRLISSGHDSVLEHAAVTFRVVCSRAISHEWVRHRIGCSYSQESTRYCNYGHAGEITVIWPWYLGDYESRSNDNPKYGPWWQAMSHAEGYYLELLAAGCKPEEARGVLPNDLKTEIVVTMNFRAIRNFVKQRISPRAHPQIRALAKELLLKVHEEAPVVFEDLMP